jgi:DDE family transposase
MDLCRSEVSLWTDGKKQESPKSSRRSDPRAVCASPRPREGAQSPALGRPRGPGVWLRRRCRRCTSYRDVERHHPHRDPSKPGHRIGAARTVGHNAQRAGGGRQKATDKDPTLLTELQEWVESTTRGDPESSVLWTARSLRNLALALPQRGHDVKKDTMARLFTQLGESLQGHKQCLEGAQPPDRPAQFEPSHEMVRVQLHATTPAIAVDTKKQEVVGS